MYLDLLSVFNLLAPKILSIATNKVARTVRCNMKALSVCSYIMCMYDNVVRLSTLIKASPTIHCAHLHAGRTCSEAGLTRNGFCSWDEQSDGCFLPDEHCYCDEACCENSDCCPDVKCPPSELTSTQVQCSPIQCIPYFFNE